MAGEYSKTTSAFGDHNSTALVEVSRGRLCHIIPWRHEMRRSRNFPSPCPLPEGRGGRRPLCDGGFVVGARLVVGALDVLDVEGFVDLVAALGEVGAGGEV